MDVRGRWAVGGIGRAVGGDGRGSVYNLDDEPGGRGHHVGDEEGTVGRRWTFGGEVLAELLEAEGGEDWNHVGVVGEVEVEGLVEGEGGGVVVGGDVVRSGSGADDVLLQTSHDFLVICDAERASSRAGECK